MNSMNSPRPRGQEWQAISKTRAARIPFLPDWPWDADGHPGATATVSVVIPAMNEAENLPHVFATIPEWIHEVVLVDGNSTDQTVGVAQRLRPGIKVVRQEGSGKGDAVTAGCAACTSDIIVLIDADGSTDGREIPFFVGALAAGADFAKGSRFAHGGGSEDLTFARRLGNRALHLLVNRIYGTRFTDLCYGFNAFWAHHWESVLCGAQGFEVETAMNIRAAKAGLRIQEIPSFERRRMHGASNLRAIPDGLRVLEVILRERPRRRPGQGSSRGTRAVASRLARDPASRTADGSKRFRGPRPPAMRLHQDRAAFGPLARMSVPRPRAVLEHAPLSFLAGDEP
jgi:hypothetical protein